MRGKPSAASRSIPLPMRPRKIRSCGRTSFAPRNIARRPRAYTWRHTRTCSKGPMDHLAFPGDTSRTIIRQPRTSIIRNCGSGRSQIPTRSCTIPIVSSRTGRIRAIASCSIRSRAKSSSANTRTRRSPTLRPSTWPKRRAGSRIGSCCGPSTGRSSRPRKSSTSTAARSSTRFRRARTLMMSTANAPSPRSG